MRLRTVWVGAAAAILCAPAAFSATDTQSIQLGTNNVSSPLNTMTQIELDNDQDMGYTTPTTVGSVNARSTAAPAGKSGQFMYFKMGTGFEPTPGAVPDLYLTVSYLDKGTDAFQVEYDATNSANMDPTMDDPVMDIHRVAGVGGSTDKVFKTDTGKILTHLFHLNEVYFGGREEGGADFRIDDLGDGIETISMVSVSKTNPIHLNIPMVSQAPKLDGVLDEPYWKTSDNLVTLCSGAQDVIRPTKWTGPDDYCGNFHFAWDNNGLYIAADVIDNVPRNNDEACGDEYAGDGFEIFWGFDQSNPGRTMQIDGEDFHWFISAPPAGMKPTWAYQTAPGNTVVVMPNGDCSTGGNATIFDRTDGKSGYIMEVKMPWSEWKSSAGVSHAAPKAGQLIGFTMFGNDGDQVMPAANGNTYDQEKALSWAGIPGPSGHPNAWLTIQLGGPASAKGDLNGDGKVDLKDATLSLGISVGLISATPTQAAADDVNGDGKTDLKDTTLILQAAVGLKQLM